MAASMPCLSWQLWLCVGILFRVCDLYSVLDSIDVCDGLGQVNGHPHLELSSMLDRSHCHTYGNVSQSTAEAGKWMPSTDSPGRPSLVGKDQG